MEKIKVHMTPERVSLSVAGQFMYSLPYDETFLQNFANIVELKDKNETQEILINDIRTIIVTLQEIKNDLQIKYWILNKDINIATAFAEMVINKKDYDRLYDMYSLFKLNKTYLAQYIDFKVSDNFKYNELRREFKNGQLVL